MFHHLRKFASCKTNVNKQRLYLPLSKDFFLLCLLAAAKSSLLHQTENFTILLTSLTSVLAVWTAPRQSEMADFASVS